MIGSLFSMVFSIIGSFLNMLKPVFIIIVASLAIIIVRYIFECRSLKKKDDFEKIENTHKKPIKHGFFEKVFVDFPKQKAYDFMHSNPNDFPYRGVVIFTGRQGSGKTISLVHAMMDMQYEYPDCKVITNLDYANEDDSLKHWKQLTDYKNGRNGVVVGIDETQNWFSCYQSKNFPPEMLTVVTQNRKNTRIILGTAQNFFLLSKALRSQCTEVRECKTLFGCLTIVTRKCPILDSNGDVKEWEKLGRYFYIHNNKLRSCYDTYKVIDNLSSSGFIETTKE